MIYIMRSLILTLIISISCKEYFETLLPKRTWKHHWMNHSLLLAFVLGFGFIALTPIPPYILQPVRVIVIIGVIVQIYFQVKVLPNLVLTLFFSGLMWVLAALTMLGLSVLPIQEELRASISEPIWNSFLLCFILIFSYKYKGRKDILYGTKWLRFGIFPVLSISISMIISLIGWYGDIFGENTQLIVLSGFGAMNIFIFYFIGKILIKDAQVQDLRLMHEHLENQMSAYQNMELSYQQQRSFMHDYKNQLNCIQGLLAKDQVREASAYIGKLTDGIRKSADYVDTNHKVVNVVLNQKYQYAQEHGITMVIAVNDLSQLIISEEDIVTLLVNLIDNAIEACQKLETDRIIQFKMVQEEDLILSIRNPVAKPVAIKGKRIASSKMNGADHGIGLRNVDAVINKHGGTSALQCADGWFCFSAMIPTKKL